VAEIVAAHTCPARRDDHQRARERDICLLYEGHPVRHSFELD
jgi:hypothetical protein